MTGGVFISYRRGDSLERRGPSRDDWLRIAFGRDHAFRDVASIGAGKWRNKIDAALADSAICVAVIGVRWLDEAHAKRLHDDNDVLRHEYTQCSTQGGFPLPGGEPTTGTA